MTEKSKKRRLPLALTVCAFALPSLSFGQEKSAAKRYLVTFKDTSRAAEILSAAQARVELALPHYKAWAVSVPESAVGSLAKNPNVEFIEEDGQRFPYSSETIPWGIDAIGRFAPESTSSSRTMVCIIDSGYHLGHADLPVSVSASSDSGTGDPLVDGCGHGTHVSGTIAALQNAEGVVGVNGLNDVDLHVVKVFDNQCSWAFTSSLIKALDECVAAAGLNTNLVVNMSLGGSRKSRTEERALAAASGPRRLFVAAAGNDGTTRKSWPASYDTVVSVGAVDEAAEIASFSQQNDQVELSAPGVNVLSTTPTAKSTSLMSPAGEIPALELEYSAKTSAQGISGLLAAGGRCLEGLPDFSGQIVICERGDISFADKLLNAQNAGAVGVIIYNNVLGSFAGTLGSASDLYAIPGVTISQEDGLRLLEFVAQAATLVNSFDPTRGGYEAWNGTSMATPHVAGAAAAIWNRHPDLDAASLRQALQQTAVDLGPIGKDNAYGYGFLNMVGAEAFIASGQTGSGGNSGGDSDSGGGATCRGKKKACN